MKNAFTFLFVSIFCISAFGQKNVRKTKSITKGQQLFDQNCSGCHNFVQNGIGPQLGGLSSSVSNDWIASFIKNPQEVINSGDERAVMLLGKYKTVMPSFDHFPSKELKAIVAYIAAQPAPDQKATRDFGEPIKDPIPEKIPMSDLVLKIEPYVQVTPSSDKKPLARLSLMSFQPQSKENYIVDLRGKLYRISEKGSELYIDITKFFPNFIDKPGLATGFGAFAFHPDFANNGLFYTTHTEAPGSAKADFNYDDSIKVTIQWVVNEWKTNDPMQVPTVATPREMMRVDMVTGLHGVQEIAFNPFANKTSEDYGKLYIGIGDGGSVESGYLFLPHNKKNIWGNVLRIDPLGRNSANGKYGNPESNPYAGTANRGEIYCMGFRNPHRFTWTTSGKLLIANIGQKQIETINLAHPGSDFGWPLREGSLRINELGDLDNVYDIPPNESLNDFNLPAVEIDHDEIGAISTILEYTGTKVPAMKGKIFFSSISYTRLLYVEEKDVLEGSRAEVKEFQVSLDGKIVSFNDLTQNSWRADLRMGKDADGELYFFTKQDGMVYKVVP
ncbi:Cytochrome c [Spirosomataceae bacterium TFI 002]|nr:Cytochrome c [Spirosomataceae bacterium TFI 002]